MQFRTLTEAETGRLIQQGCSASDWSSVLIAPSCDLGRIHNVRFLGSARIAENNGTLSFEQFDLPCGLYDCAIADCDIGPRARISNVGTLIARVSIGADVLIEDIGMFVNDPDASFGNRVELDVWNEGGGRTAPLFNKLTAQSAYLYAALRHNKEFSQTLDAMYRKEADASIPARGGVGAGARIVRCGSLKNVNIGPAAVLQGAQSLEDGTILSAPEHPTAVGEGVNAKHFVIAEGARVESGVLLDKVFVGQGVKMGKQFSAENSVFFANCEAFHGEAVAVVAGPYTVTHHKSTLLIAGMFSFYNAGSGTNQSNHMYKLGPVHQGVFERGCKTGSFSYVLFESRIGAFSALLGKHLTNINTPNLPFSYIYEKGGDSFLVPGMNIFSVGTVRDGEKWPKRDSRKVADKRDLIIFDVYSPYTIEKMRLGRDELLALNEGASKERDSILYGGVQIRTVLLRKGAKFYASAVQRYLAEKTLDALAQRLRNGASWKSATTAFTPAAGLSSPRLWTDLSGLLAPVEVVKQLEQDVIAGTVSSYDILLQRFADIASRYREYEWQYVYDAFTAEFGYAPCDITKDQALTLIDEWKKISLTAISAIAEDAKKEYSPTFHVSFGLDLPPEEAEADFEAVRGTAESNSVVKKLIGDTEAINAKADELAGLMRKSAH